MSCASGHAHRADGHPSYWPSPGTPWPPPGKTQRPPTCARTFANPHQTHTCAPLGDLTPHFAGKDPLVRDTFDRVLAVVRSFGPVSVLLQKTRIALHVRMSFAAFQPRTRWLDGHLVLARRAAHPTFLKIETYSPRNTLHTLRLHTPTELDPDLFSEAHAVGQQAHLRPQ